MAAFNVNNWASSILVQGLVTGDFPKQNLYHLLHLRKQKSGHKSSLIDRCTKISISIEIICISKNKT